VVTGNRPKPHVRPWRPDPLHAQGQFIWTPTTPPLFLDGEAFGFRQNGETLLNLPSGDRRRGGDFEMWFWLIAQPVALQSLVPPEISMFQGDTATGTITLTAPATAGLVVPLTNSAPSVATVPPNVPFNLGFTSASFPITAAPQGQGQTTITATLGASQAMTVTVAQRPVTLTNLQITPAIVARGFATTGTITLSGAAPAGAAISLGSSNTAVVTVPASVSAAGATTVKFTITTVSLGTAVITATFGNSLTETVTVVKTKDKDKDKDKDKEKETVIDKITNVEKIREVVALPASSMPGATRIGSGIGGQAANGRAFIRPDERPVIAPPG